MSLTRRAFLGGGAALCISAVARGEVPARTLTATDVHVSDYPTVQALRWIGETLTQETGGRIGLRVYHSGQLGREGDAINMRSTNVASAVSRIASATVV